MEFITVEQFKEQPIEVQKVFLDWWKPSIGDIYVFINCVIENKLGCIEDKFDSVQIKKYVKDDTKNYVIDSNNKICPLFTEGQLRKFIEDKIESKLMIEYTCCENIVIKLAKTNKTNGCFEVYKKYIFQENKYNLLETYWRVACIVAKEGLDG